MLGTSLASAVAPSQTFPPMILLMAAVAFLDGLVTYLNIKEREEWISGNVTRSVMLDGLTTAAMGVTVLLFVEFTWAMLAPSVAGSMVGRWLAWRF